ncbi:hypothetical protein Hte_007360 [Hypoxylon texense]
MTITTNEISHDVMPMPLGAAGREGEDEDEEDDEEDEEDDDEDKGGDVGEDPKLELARVGVGIELEVPGSAKTAFCSWAGSIPKPGSVASGRLISGSQIQVGPGNIGSHDIEGVAAEDGKRWVVKKRQSHPRSEENGELQDDALSFFQTRLV